MSLLSDLGVKLGLLSVRVQHRLRRTFGPRRDEVTGEWRKPHNEELHDLYSSPSIIRIIKSKRVRWAWHVALRRRRRILTGHWWEGQKERED
jgi:hypothetical protein